jgi:hypothetical protein
MKDEQKIEVAIERAYRHLQRLSIHSWNEPAIDRRSEHEAAIAAIETILGGIEQVIKIVLPVLKQARPARGEHGRSGKLYSFRDQVIRETATAVYDEQKLARQKLTWEETYTALAKALDKIKMPLSERSIKNICESRGKKTPK